MIKILLIEDEPKTVQSLKQGLEENSYEVEVAYDGTIAKQLALRNTYSLIVSDIIIPGINGIELCKQLGSPNFKILFDIYHMQIDEGDIIRSIQDSHAYFGHYHTAGVPGRHELDDRQELNYPAIMRAIKATGYKGYVAHEFIATNPDKISSLKQAVTVCDI